MRRHFPLLLVSLWLAAAWIGIGLLSAYDGAPGGVAGVPGHWPSKSKLPHPSGRPTLIMFVHPKCPCTRASIGELAVLMTHCQGRVTASVVFLRPKGSGEDWPHTGLWRSAEAIPGVTARADEGGNEAASFKVTTSGHVVLYDLHGKLLFSGGITSSRGHYGDNAGLSAIVDLLNHGAAAMPETPVFGCSLLDPKSECSAKDPLCKRRLRL